MFQRDSKRTPRALEAPILLVLTPTVKTVVVSNMHILQPMGRVQGQQMNLQTKRNHQIYRMKKMLLVTSQIKLQKSKRRNSQFSPAGDITLDGTEPHKRLLRQQQQRLRRMSRITLHKMMILFHRMMRQPSCELIIIYMYLNKRSLV